ncbi:MAG: ribonuclease III, partial [Deltaproteobacteria bacterium]|nr:ribonuclease III [Deltaproteobacteria bacterium]
MPTDPRERELMRLAAVERIVERLGIARDGAHLQEAFTHPSLTNEQKAASSEPVRDNQRLEFLGDSVLGLCVSELLMTTWATLDEGQLTFMRAAL